MRVPNDSAPLRVVQPRSDDDDDIAISVEGYRHLIPVGWYSAKFVGWDTRLMFKTPKAFLRFEIVEQGEFFGQGIRLARPYRVRRVDKPVGPNGKFVLDAGGDLYRMLLRVLDVQQRRDRISLRALKHLPLRILTRTVTKDREQHDLPSLARYSVVEDVARDD